MNLTQAMHSGRPFRRQGFKPWMHVNRDGFVKQGMGDVPMTVDLVNAQDYEIAPLALVMTGTMGHDVYIGSFPEKDLDELNAQFRNRRVRVTVELAE